MKASEKFEKLNAEAMQIKKILMVYPDIEINKDRWGKEYYTSTLANKDIDSSYTTHSCGCCPDPLLYLYTYVDLECGVRVFSSPKSFTLGIKNACYDYYDDDEDDYDIKPYNMYGEWPEEMRKAGLPETFIKRCEELYHDAYNYYDD